jgi:hypothetical protein
MASAAGRDEAPVEAEPVGLAEALRAATRSDRALMSD